MALGKDADGRMGYVAYVARHFPPLSLSSADGL